MPGGGGWVWLWRGGGMALIAAVVWLSLTPQPPTPPGWTASDKLGHVAAYAALMRYHAWVYPGRRAAVSWALFLVLLGVALEFLQGWGGLRRFEVADMAANALGVLLGWLPVLWNLPRRRAGAARNVTHR